MAELRCMRPLRCDYTLVEKRVLGEELAHLELAKVELEAKKKEVTGRFSADIAAAAGLVIRLADKIRAGYEMRDVECAIEFDKPTVGMKRIVRLDTGEMVEEVQMTPAERQHKLGFE